MRYVVLTAADGGGLMVAVPTDSCSDDLEPYRCEVHVVDVGPEHAQGSPVRRVDLREALEEFDVVGLVGVPGDQVVLVAALETLERIVESARSRA